MFGCVCPVCLVVFVLIVLACCVMRCDVMECDRICFGCCVLMRLRRGVLFCCFVVCVVVL